MKKGMFKQVLSAMVLTMGLAGAASFRQIQSSTVITVIIRPLLLKRLRPRHRLWQAVYTVKMLTIRPPLT